MTTRDHPLTTNNTMMTDASFKDTTTQIPVYMLMVVTGGHVVVIGGHNGRWWSLMVMVVAGGHVVVIGDHVVVVGGHVVALVIT